MAIAAGRQVMEPQPGRLRPGDVISSASLPISEMPCSDGISDGWSLWRQDSLETRHGNGMRVIRDDSWILSGDRDTDRALAFGVEDDAIAHTAVYDLAEIT